MFSIKPMIFSNGEEYINLTGNKLKTKFSILERGGVYFVTSAKGNAELISFLDTKSYLRNKKLELNGYFWWNLENSKVITVLNEVMREFGECK